MARYIALLDGDAGGFGAVFPDFPGCTAMGNTPEEALANATEALREWMSDRVAAGRLVPTARSVEMLRREPAWSAEVAAAVLASVPLLLDQERSVPANLSIDAGLLAPIDDAARERGLTRSAFLASAARDKIMAGR